MKLYKMEYLCKGEWIVRSIWARDFRYMLNMISERPKEALSCLRIRRVASEQEAKEILAIDDMHTTPFNIDEIEWVTA